MVDRESRRALVLALCGSSILVALGAVLPANGAAPEPLRLVSDEWPPFTDAEGKPRRALALVEAALKRGNVRSSVTILKWTSAISLLNHKNFDGTAAIWKDAEREKTLLFSKPYFQNRLVLVGRLGSDVSAKAVAQLEAGKRLALTSGYAYSPAVTKAANVHISHHESDAACLRAVLAKQADYLLLDELVVRHLFRRYADKANKLIVAGQVALDEHALYFALRKDYPGAAQIIASFNGNVEKMMADGTYNELLDLPWIQTDTDQDGQPEYVASSRSAAQADGDPYATHGGYPVFQPSTRAPDTGRAPEYLIDGKSYNSWGDAATTLQRSTPPGDADLYKYSTGFVLGEF